MIKLNELNFNDYLDLKETLMQNIIDNLDLRNETEEIELEDSTTKLRLNHLLINLILLRPYKQFNQSIKSTDILNCEGLTSRKFDDRLQELLEIFYTAERKLQLNDALACIIEDMNYLTLKFNIYRGLTMDVYSIAKLANENEKFDELIHTTVDEENNSIPENEKYIQDKFSELVDLVKEDGNEMCFTTYLKCGEGLNLKQLRQYAVNTGYKPTVSGSVYPIPINCNLLTGLKKPSHYYIDAGGSRKAVIINSTEVKDSGYLARRFTLATINTILNQDVDDCMSENYLNVDLESVNEKRAENTLKRLIGRFGKVDGKQIEITKSNYKDFIGKNIQLRSPITCACKKGICKKCYGRLAELNNDIHIGKLGVDILSSQLTQILLSSKHLLDTKSEQIEWSKNFLQILKVNGNVISPAKNFKASNISLLIEREDLDLESYMHNNCNDNSLFITKLSVLHNDKKIRVNLPKKLYPSPELVTYLKSCDLDEEMENFVIEMKDFNMEQSLFYFVIENNELSSHLYRLQDLIERKDHLGFTTIDSLMNEMYEVLNKSGLRISSIHIENLVRELVKNTNNKKRPDFGQPISEGEYEILTLDNSILYNESLAVGLAFEQITKQFLDPTTYEKDAESFLDHIFK